MSSLLNTSLRPENGKITNPSLFHQLKEHFFQQSPKSFHFNFFKGRQGIGKMPRDWKEIR